MNFPIPEPFKQNTLELFGASGAAWLEQLPALLAELEQRWAIRMGPPFKLSYNYVAPAERAGGPAVIKVGHPNPEMHSEMTALKYFNGRGIVQLFEMDLPRGAMLIERLQPGAELLSLPDDDEATRIAAQVMRDLWIPAPADPEGVLCRAEKWARGLGRLRKTFDGGTGPFPSRLIELAEHLFDELLASVGPMALLHGDLHHMNILSAERRPWLALDPKGLIGEREYEVGPLLYNRWPENPGPRDLQRLSRRRLEILHEVLGFDFQRMLAWATAEAVLSAWWSYEDHRRVDEEMISYASELAEMLK